MQGSGGDDDGGPFGPVLFAYTREQALADGVLVDVTQAAKEAGFRLPVAVTRAVWDRYVTVPAAVPWQDEDGRLWDILWMCRHGISSAPDRYECLFQLMIANEPKPPETVTLKAICGPGDEGEPVITIMLPNED